MSMSVSLAAGKRPFGRPRWRAVAAILLFLVSAGPPGVAQTANEAALKAAFLHNFIRFTEWPSDAPNRRRAVLCVLDDEVVAGELEAVERAAVPAPLGVVRRVTPRDDLRACSLLYLAALDPGQASSILQAVEGAPVLTVGDQSSFTRAGGIIDFYLENNRMRFEINVNAAHGARLKISSRLLSLARIVEDNHRAQR
jgi:YfiR/HmsC-like